MHAIYYYTKITDAALASMHQILTLYYHEKSFFQFTSSLLK